MYLDFVVSIGRMLSGDGKGNSQRHGLKTAVSELDTAGEIEGRVNALIKINEWRRKCTVYSMPDPHADALTRSTAYIGNLMQTGVWATKTGFTWPA